MASVPGAPYNVRVTSQGRGWAVVAWNTSTTGSSPITEYYILASDGQSKTVAPSNIVTFDTLTNGGTYTFKVLAKNAVGYSAYSASSAAITMANVPGAPTGVYVSSSGDGSATVNWTAPASNGGQYGIGAYIVVASTGQTVTVDAVARSANVTGLTNGTSVTFTVKANNYVGDSAFSSASAAVTPSRVPDAPTGVYVSSSGYTDAWVNWTAPAFNGGAGITGYTVTCSDGKTANVNGSTLSAYFSGLTPGVAVTFTVTATNLRGTSASSAASGAVTPAKAPDAPSGVSAVSGNTSATVSWTAPASNGAAITGYTVTPSVGSAVTVGNVTTASFTGLTNGTALTFTVTATNVRGTSGPSTASAAVTPSTVPDAPTGVSAVAGNVSSIVSWTAPASNGGAAITGYTVIPSVGSAVTVGNVLTATVTGLAAGKSVTFTVKATNVRGNSASSAPSFTGVPFSPTQIPGLQMWLDGADPVGTGTQPSAGTAITTWADKSGKGNSGTGVAGPTFLAGGGIALNGTSQYYTTTYTAAPATETAFVVFKISSNSGIQVPIGHNGVTGNRSLDFTANSSTSLTRYFTSTIVSGVTTISTNSQYMYGYTYTSGGNTTLYVNGKQDAIATNSAAFSGAGGYTTIGYYPYANSYIGGTIHEVIIFNTVLTLEQREKMEGYLSWKWGLAANLQDTHPYYSIAPTAGPVVLLQAKSYSGTGTWNDSSSYGRNATLAAGISAKNAEGNGIVLNGSSYWTFPNVGVGNAWTANVWFKRTGNQTAGSACILAQQFPGTVSRINIAIGDIVNANNNTVSGGFWNGGFVNGTACALPLNTWVNIQVSWNGANLITYMNGAFNSSLASSVVAEANGVDYNIGKRWDSASYMVGEIGEVRIYNYALSEAQVVQDYNNSRFTFQQPITPFTPNQILGLQMWLDGADPAGTGTQPSAGTAVTTWVDKSGKGNSGTGVSGPTYSTGGGIALNGTSQYYTTTYTGVPSTETTFVVIKFNNSNNGEILGAINTFSGGRQFSFYQGKVSTANFNLVGYPGGATEMPINTTLLLDYTFTSGTMNFYYNGAQDGRTTGIAYSGSGTTSIGATIYGNSTTLSSPLNGTIYEVIAYNTVLTLQQRQNVEGYLSWKWGLATSLQNTHPYYSVVPRSLYPISPFTPNQISGLQMWLDGSDPSGTGTQPSTGTAITTWVDKSGKGNSGTGVAGPTYAAGGGIAFNGTSQYFTTNYTAAAPTESIFVVYNTNSLTSLGALVDSSASGGRQFGLYSATAGPSLAKNSISWSLVGSYAITTGTTYIAECTYNTSGVNLYVTGNPSANNTTNPGFTAGTTTIGAGYFIDIYGIKWFLNGTIHEVIIFNTVLSLQERQAVEGYLAWKWGLKASLQDTNPYYSNSITAFTVPGAPTGVSAVGGNASATVSWTAPSNGGSEITGYTVTPSVGSAVTVGNVTTADFTGLTNGTALTFTVTAINAAGSSVDSSASSAVTPATVPDAPSGVSAVAGNASATVSWTAPASNGSAITGYTVTPSVGSPVTVGNVLTATVTNLTNGTAVTFTVKAINSVGNSLSSSASSAVTPATVPNAPTSVSAVAGNASATVSWTAPSNGGSAITGYTVTPSVGSPLTVGNVLTATLNGLTNGTPLTFTVKAINSVGNSSASSASSAVTPATVPDAPSGVSAVAGNASATVSWTAPASNGSAITGYTVTPSVGSPVTVGNVLNANLTGLTNGTAVTFTVKAINSVGNSSASLASSAVTPATVPNAPTSVSAVASNVSAIVSWTAPSNGGSAITGYTVTPSVGSPLTVGNVTTATVTGLANGTAVTFTVKAINSVGNSLASSASSAVTPVTVPDSPTGVSAVAGNASATVSWVAPASNGGATIIAYKVTSSLGHRQDVPGNVLTAYFTNLTNGTPITFTVQSWHNSGDSVASTASAAVTPATLPDVPTGLSAVAGNKSVTVSWTAPASNGGSEITGYTLTPSLGSPVTVGNVLTATVSNLTNGTAVTFTVKATNSVGSSSTSSSVTATPTGSLPGAPTDVSAVAGNASATVSWIAPTSDIDSPITGYLVTPSIGTAVTVGTVLTTSFSNLTNGTPITFTVKTINAAGSSSASSSPTVTPSTVPDAPTGVYISSPGYTDAWVTWFAPAFNGGATITQYTVTCSDGKIVNAALGANVDAYFSGLTPGVAVTFTVTATNLRGTSVSSAASAAYTPAKAPDAPSGVSAVAGNASATVSWTVPASNGAAITGYIVTPSVGSALTVGNVTTASFTNLTNGTPLTFTVKATNVRGDSLDSSASAAVTPSKVADAPTGVSAVAGNASATVSWTAPGSNGGSVITGYTVTPSVGSPLTVGNVTTASFTGLTNGTALTFTVKATNVRGDSVASAASAAVTPATVPDAPSGVSAVAGNASATVSWTAPAYNGGSAITGYIVTPSVGSALTVGNVTTASFTNLTNGTALTFTVKATNVRGDSSASSASSAVTPMTVPGAPTGVSAVAGNASATVSWNEPSNGGSEITGYTVTPSVGSPVTVRNVRIATLSGLTNGTPVTFTVKAINSVGSSSASSSSAVTPVASLPGSPTGISAVAGTNSTTVSWNAPVSSGGSAITGYVVTPSVGSPITVGNVLTADLPTVTSDGTPITYTVVAINAAGSSSSSLPRPAVTPATAPGAPTGVSVVAGNGSATVSWNPPASNGGSPITGYIVTPSVGSPITVGNVGIVTFDGLSNGTPITFTVTAINAVGSSSEPVNSPAPSAVTPVATLPGTPTGISVVPGANSATVSWTAPVVTGGSPITGYIITPSSGSPITVGSDVLTANFPSLANGTPVTFTVTAINSSGSSSASVAPPITPATLPGAPTGVSVVAGNGSATVSWNPPASNGGSPITGYIVTPSVGSPITVGNVGIVTFDGLSNGTPITFTVTAINAVGNSLEPVNSPPPSAVTPVATLPGAPTGITAVPGVNSATVSWNPPTVTGGSPITGYIITPSVGEPFTVGNVLTATLPVLSDGTPVTFTVTAINSSGSSSASSAPPAITPPSEASVPGAPTGVSAVAANASATVSWTAPSNGGSTIIGYTVTPSVGSSVTVGNVLNATVSNLSNGTAVTFTVKAINAVGNSSASSASSAVTPMTVPGAPTGVSAVAGNASATVSWNEPSNGGSEITGYTVTPSVGSPVTVRNVRIATLSGLTNGTALTFTVKAINAVGSSSASSSSAVTPVASLPGSPTGISAVAGTNSTTVSWNAPVSSGSSAITGYIVTPSVGSPITVGNVLTADLPTVTSDGTPITYTVVAINSSGSSSSSLPRPVVAPATAPGAPTSVSVVAGNGSATVSWNPPASNGGSAITGYIVTPSVGNPITVGNVGIVTFDGLSNGTPITFTVTAINAVGSSSVPVNSPAPSPVTPVATLPGTPTGISVVPGANSATVSWNPPTVTGGSPITGYIVTPSVGSPITVGSDVLTANFPTLANGTPVTFTVTAINSSGSSSASVAPPITPAALPGAPTGVSVVAGNGSATVSWNPPASNGGSPITGYIITPSVGNPITVGNVGIVTFDGLTNGTPITFTVTAINAVGSSSVPLDSPPPSAVTPVATLPSAPTGITVVPGVNSATVSWNPPAVTGGSAITGYIITPSVGEPFTVGDVLTATLPVLSDGTPVTFTVTAINSSGSSSASSAPPAITPPSEASVPGAPTGVSAVAGINSATVSWTAPSNGGSTITGYTVTPSLGSSVTVSNATSATLNGLASGIAVTFTVKAINAVGNSTASSASSAVTPFTVPGAPTGVSAVAGNASATISWNAPSDGGSEITGYTVTPSLGSPVTVRNVRIATLSGLTNGTALTFTVKAINAVGSSSASSSAAATPIAALPTAPTGISAVVANGSTTVSWNPPVSSGSSAITGYIVTPSVGNPITVGNVLTADLPTVTSDGTPITYTVVAINTAGSSSSSLPRPAVTPAAPATAPGAPTGVSVVAGNGSATVSWNPPASNGGSAITGYIVTPSVGSPITVGNVGIVTFDGLSNGTPITFTVTAINAVGSSSEPVNSPASPAPSAVTPVATLPAAPTGISVVPGANSATVSWNPPTVTGGSPITGYIITPSVGSPITVGSDVLTANFPTLANGTPVTFTVTAINSSGSSSASVAPPITPAALPGAPTGVSVVAGNGSATVSWNPPASNGGSPITGYIVTPSVGNPITVGNVGIVTFDGLTNGTPITFTVTAINAVGSSSVPLDSPPPPAVTPVATLPSAPTGISVVPGINSATVSWNPPAVTGGSAITGYIITPSVGPPFTVGDVLTATLPVLSDGTPVTFTVTAINSSGSSSASVAPAAVTPPSEASVPGAPTSVSAVAGNASATVSWTAPASNGGSTIIGYTVTPSVGSSVTVGNVLNATVSNLTNGTAVTFTVKAINAVGNSTASSASSAVTPIEPATVPGAPTGVSAVAGNASATVSWTAPSDGGSEITGYTVTPSVGSPVTVRNVRIATLSGLTNGTALTFTVTAINAVGSSSASSSAAATPIAALPSAPTGISAVAGTNSTTVSWNAPVVSGDSPITGYIITPSSGSPITVGNVLTADLPTVSSDGTPITYTVVAINAAGSSSSSLPRPAVTPATAPGAPTGVSVVAGNGSATVSWNPPASNGGSAITGYIVTPSVGSPITVGNVGIVTFDGLSNGTPITFTVTAINAVGSSSVPVNSPAPAPVTPVATLPAAPTGISVVPGANSATVSWTAPVVTGGSPITGYIITPSSGSPITVGSDVLTANFPALANGTPVTFTVTAINSSGSSSASVAPSAITPAALPGAPTGVSVVAGNGSATVSWNPPASNGGSPITGYIITPSVGSPITVGNVEIVTFDGLSNGTPITFTVTAINAVGNSLEPVNSPPPSAVTPVATLPSAPTGISVVPGVNSATVSWTAPAVTGGSAITGYIITPSVGPPFTVGDVLTATLPVLSDGTPVTFTVTAINSSGSSSASVAPPAITPPSEASVPGAPADVSAVAANASATVSWFAPASNGGSTIIGYTVTPSVGSPVTVGNVLTASFTNLTNGTAVTFTVKAINAVGNSAASSASSAVTPITVAGAPTGVSAVAGTNSATVSWTAPASNGGSAITGYTVTSSTSDGLTVGNVTTATLNGLASGIPITFTVIAINSVGPSLDSSASSAVTPIAPVTVPGAPTGITAVAGTNSVTVSWTAPASDGGSEITAYTVTPSLGVAVTVGNVLTATLTGLAGEIPITVTVVAINALGNSSASTSSSVTPTAPIVSPPSAVLDVTGVTGVAGDASATIRWVAPVSDGGSPITGYKVLCAPNNRRSNTAASDARELLVTNLKNAAPTTCTVVAVNAAAQSDSVSFTSYALPGVPKVKAVRGAAGVINLTWTAKASNPASPITGYVVSLVLPSVAPQSMVLPTPLLTPTGGSVTVSGLKYGSNCVFSVKSVSNIGQSAASLSNMIVAAGLPDAPSSFAGIKGVASAGISWVAPRNTGGLPIIGYVISYMDAVVSTKTLKVQHPTTSVMVKNLVDGRPYVFTIKAITIFGTSLASEPVVVTPGPGL